MYYFVCTHCESKLEVETSEDLFLSCDVCGGLAVPDLTTVGVPEFSEEAAEKFADALGVIIQGNPILQSSPLNFFDTVFDEVERNVWHRVFDSLEERSELYHLYIVMTLAIWDIPFTQGIRKARDYSEKLAEAIERLITEG